MLDATHSASGPNTNASTGTAAAPATTCDDTAAGQRRGEVQKGYRPPASNRVYATVVGFCSAALNLVCRRRACGLEHIPAHGGALLVSNHISDADPVVLGTVLYRTGRRARAMAKSSLFTTPGIGWFITRMGHIPVPRGTARAKDALSSAVAAAQAGELIAIYPEGTVPDPALWLAPAKSGAARLAMLTGVPVIPVAQWGPQRLLPQAGALTTLVTLLRAAVTRPVMHIRIGEPFTVTGDPDNRADVEAGTALIMSRIADQLTGLRPR